MKISRKEDYGVVLMSALSAGSADHPLSLETISKTHRLPLAFIRLIARDLIKANLIQSKEGVRGGYYLSKSADSITLKEVLEALSGPTKLTQCTVDHSCELESRCPTREPWQKLHALVNHLFETMTLEQLTHQRLNPGR